MTLSPQNIFQMISGLGDTYTAAYNQSRKTGIEDWDRDRKVYNENLANAAADEKARILIEAGAAGAASSPGLEPPPGGTPGVAPIPALPPVAATGAPSMAAGYSRGRTMTLPPVAAATPLAGDRAAVRNRFMSVVDDRVTNPFGLAAIDATAQHEGGWNPTNLTRTWNDPSESGAPGRSGGLLSHRGDRYDRRTAFMQARGGPSPENEALFLLQEDPRLIARLNAARSPGEAASLMANAWMFAGYNRPGGEAQRRLNTTERLASQYGTTVPGGPSATGGPVRVASASGVTIPVRAPEEPIRSRSDALLPGTRTAQTMTMPTLPSLPLPVGGTTGPAGPAAAPTVAPVTAQPAPPVAAPARAPQPVALPRQELFPPEIQRMLRSNNRLVREEGAKLAEPYLKPGEWDLTPDQAFWINKKTRAAVRSGLDKPRDQWVDIPAPPGQTGAWQQNILDGRRQVVNQPEADRWIDIPTPEGQVGQWQRNSAGQTRVIHQPEPEQYEDIETSDGTVRQRSALTNRVITSGPQTVVNNNAAAVQREADKKISGAYADNYIKIQEEAQDARTTKNALRLMETLTKDENFYSGTGGPQAATINRALAAMGWKGPQAASVAEAFAAFANQVTIDKMGGKLGAGVSNTDVSFIATIAPQLGVTPQGNRLIIDFTRRIMDRKEETARRARKYIKEHGNLDAGWDDEVEAWADANPLFSPDDIAEAQKKAHEGGQSKTFIQSITGGKPPVEIDVPGKGRVRIQEVVD